MEYKTEKIRYISHEIKNQLSICDLYTEILQKYCNKSGIYDETISKSINNIKRAVYMAGISLIDLKTYDTLNIEKISVNSIIIEGYELSKVYGYNKNINIELNLTENYKVMADKNKLLGVIINIIKNACEAFDEDFSEKNIKIYTKKEDNILNIIISNNANPVEDKELIFNEGYTTKKSGSGLGLYICKKNIEEMSGRLLLLKSDKNSTDFAIQLGYL